MLALKSRKKHKKLQLKLIEIKKKFLFQIEYLCHLLEKPINPIHRDLSIDIKYYEKFEPLCNPIFKDVSELVYYF